MAETLSPNPKLRAPFSPVKSPFFIASNDDKLERAQARAARAAAVRRKSVVHTTSTSSDTDPCLGKEQILELFQNCIKLASENKINQRNTWELNLIDHLCEIIKVEEENDAETNFQKASCTLEAGVKIYSMRVDSVYSEAYKVLGGINRVGQEDQQDNVTEDTNIGAEKGDNDEKKERKKLSPLSTLEPSFAAINVKKFDVAFVVDPLYHQTSAQFDEGGAKGLLLNNLGVYDNCRVLFDSLEVPGKCSFPLSQCEVSETVDLSFASECIQEMVSKMLKTSEITPSLRSIINLFDDDDQRPSLSYSSDSTSLQATNQPDLGLDLDGDAPGNSGTWGFDHNDQESASDEDTYGPDTMFPSHQEVPDLVSEQVDIYENDPDGGFEEVDQYLFSSLGFSTKQNAWAGPNHWKYRKVKAADPEVPVKENSSPKKKRTKNKKQAQDIEFSNALSALSTDFSLIFAPPKNPKSLLLPANRTPINTKLPEDCHYQPENLVKLFLLPHVSCLGNSRRKRNDGEYPPRDGFGADVSWDDEDDFGGGGDDEQAYDVDIQEPSTLVKPPRQVSKIEVQYDKTSKQVDVHALKETIWEHILLFSHNPAEEQAPKDTISFKQLLASFPDSCRAAASLEDISPHLCFICLLHLANEHGLHILGCPTFDELNITLKPHK